MAANQFVSFATGNGANTESPTAFLADPVRQQGFQAGPASSTIVNTALRQATSISAMMGQFIAENGNTNANDDGNIVNLLAGFRLGISGLASLASYVVDTSTTPGTITVARTPAIQQYQPGLPLQIRLSQPIPGPSFINANGLGPVPVKRAGGGQLAQGDFLVGDILPVIFDGSSFIVLAAINQAVIDSPITKTVHGANADFVDFNAAQTWLARRSIPQGGSVLLTVAAGVGPSRIIYSTDVNFTHRDGARIAIVGQPLTNAIPAPSALVNTGFSASARAADTATNLATLRGVYSTEINMTGGKRFQITGDIGNVQDILFTNDGVSNGDTLALRFGSHALNRVASVGAGNRGITALFSYTFISGICHTIGCGIGFSAEVAGFTAVQSGGALSGISCAAFGLNAQGGNILCADLSLSQLYGRGCGVLGISINGACTSVASSTSVMRDCGQAGVSCVNNASFAANGMSGSGSPIIFQAGTGGYIDASNGVNGFATSGSATNVAFRAFLGGLITRAGTTATGTNGVSSPAVGTLAADGAGVY
jgi:hypothetical protein